MVRAKASSLDTAVVCDANHSIQPKLTEPVRMFNKHGQKTLWEFSEMMYTQYGAQVAILVGYIDCESEPAITLCISPSIILLSNSLTHRFSYDNNHKLEGTSFKDRHKQWPNEPFVDDFSKWTSESFGLNTVHFKIYMLTQHIPRSAT
jgi:hypothetical protein